LLGSQTIITVLQNTGFPTARLPMIIMALVISKSVKEQIRRNVQVVCRCGTVISFLMRITLSLLVAVILPLPIGNKAIAEQSCMES
jgi:hypothetical protein